LTEATASPPIQNRRNRETVWRFVLIEFGLFPSLHTRASRRNLDAHCYDRGFLSLFRQRQNKLLSTMAVGKKEKWDSRSCPFIKRLFTSPALFSCLSFLATLSPFSSLLSSLSFPSFHDDLVISLLHLLFSPFVFFALHYRRPSDTSSVLLDALF
jgi:hypothetical protein